MPANKFLGRPPPQITVRRPAPGTSLGAIAPGVIPVAQASPYPIRLPQENQTENRDLLEGKGVVPFTARRGYWAKFAERAANRFRDTFEVESTIMPGVEQTLLIGAFEVPEMMTACVRWVSFRAYRAVGGFEEQVPFGDLARQLSFAIMDNGHQLGVNSFTATPPAGNFTFGTGTNAQRPAQVPGAVFQAGPGVATEEGDEMYFLGGGQEFGVIVTALASLPFAITSCQAVLSGLLISAVDLQERMNSVDV